MNPIHSESPAYFHFRQSLAELTNLDTTINPQHNRHPGRLLSERRGYRITEGKWHS